MQTHLFGYKHSAFRKPCVEQYVERIVLRNAYIMKVFCQRLSTILVTTREVWLLTLFAESIGDA